MHVPSYFFRENFVLDRRIAMKIGSLIHNYALSFPCLFQSEPQALLHDFTYTPKLGIQQRCRHKAVSGNRVERANDLDVG